MEEELDEKRERDRWKESWSFDERMKLLLNWCMEVEGGKVEENRDSKIGLGHIE